MSILLYTFTHDYRTVSIKRTIEVEYKSNDHSIILELYKYIIDIILFYNNIIFVNCNTDIDIYILN